MGEKFCPRQGVLKTRPKDGEWLADTLLSFSVSKSSRNSEKLGKTLTRKKHGVTEKLNDSRQGCHGNGRFLL